MSLTRNQYEKYTESFLKPVATISIGTIIVVWCSQWLPHVPNPTPVETFIVAVSFLCYFVLLFAGKNYQQVRLFTITTLGAANAVVLFNPGNPHSATIAYLVLEISVIGAVQLYQRWWTASVVAVWVAWLVELWRADVESLYPQITTSIPLAVATALSLYLNRRLRTRAVSDALTHQRAVDESRTDALTGLLNRRGFRAEVENRKTVAATFIDVNGLKKSTTLTGMRRETPLSFPCHTPF